MEELKTQSCFYQGRIYPNASEIHGYMQGMVCKNGEWHDVDEGIIDSKPSLAYVYH
jgi:hypothetical protein